MPEVGLVKLVAATGDPLQTVIFAGTVTVGEGFTVMVYVLGVPVQLLAVGITVMVAEITLEEVLVAMKLAIFPEPLAPNPMAVLLLIHEYVAPAVALIKEVAVTVAPLQTVIFAGTVTVGVGFTVMV